MSPIRTQNGASGKSCFSSLVEGLAAGLIGAAGGFDPETFRVWYERTLQPGWTVPPHIAAMCAKLDAVTRGEIDRLALFMPPRHAKSETATIRYPVFRLLQRPTLRVLVTGYNERFARKLGRKTRNLAVQHGLKLASDSAAQDEWSTTDGGLLMARGVGSPPTGQGFDLILIDDPIKSREEADSEVFRESAWEWYSEEIYSRLEPGGAIVLTLTRWHEDDVAARALASEPFDALRLPALAEPGDPLGREPGEALWPERFGVEELSRIRSVMRTEQGERAWEALFQQNPTPREGAFFKVGSLTIEDRPPACSDRVRAWDLAASVDGDWTVGVLMGRAPDGRFVVLDVVRGRWTPGEVEQQIRRTAESDGFDVRIRLPEDPGAGGVAWARRLVSMLAGYNVRAVRVSGRGDKTVRASPLAAQIESGNVFCARRMWTGAFVEELRAFPAGKHDDQVDAAADAFDELAGVKPVEGFHSMFFGER